MMGWNCADCGKEIQDTRYHRELQLEDRFIKGECSLDMRWMWVLPKGAVLPFNLQGSCPERLES